MEGIIGKKIGMTSIFDQQGNNIPCTVIHCPPCKVTQIKTQETDKYNAIQIGAGDRRVSKANKDLSKLRNYANKPLAGHFSKAGVTPRRKVVELRDYDGKEVKLGQDIKVDVFNEGEYVDVAGTSKGKGFQGVVKRHGFAGVGQATHGQHNRLRAPGSIGACATPSRVFKNMKMAGRMGNERVTLQNLLVLKIDQENDLILVKGSVPGPKKSYVIVTK